MLLPDSRTQIVKYMADDANGYTADVQYEGQARTGAGAGAYGAPAYQGGAGGFQGGYQARKYIFSHVQYCILYSSH